MARAFPYRTAKDKPPASVHPHVQETSLSSPLALDDIRFDIDGVVSGHRAPGDTSRSSGRGAARSIAPQTESPAERLAPTTLFSCDWCTVHHLAAGTIPHRVEMERESHTLLVFDAGSHSDGERLVDGVRLGTAGPLDIGIDVVPAHAHLVAWSGTTTNIGVSFISLDNDSLPNVIGEQAAITAMDDLRSDVNLRNDLLVPLLTRVRRWPMEQGSEFDSIQRETILALVVQEIMRHQNLRSGAPLAPQGGLSSRAQRLVREFVTAHYETKVQLQTLADLVGISRFHFSRAFKASFGMPPHRYLMSERIRVAAAKLRQTQDSITDIAMQVGFSSAGELTRLFKRRMGCTPSEFRSEHYISVATAALQDGSMDSCAK